MQAEHFWRNLTVYFIRKHKAKCLFYDYPVLTSVWLCDAVLLTSGIYVDYL